MSPAVSGRDAEVHLLPGALNHAEHLELGLEVEAVSALALHQRGPRPHHALQPLLEGVEQLLLRGLARALHREVDPSSSPVDVHVCGSCQLNTRLIVSANKCREVAGRSTEPTCRGDIQHDSQSICHGTSDSERGGERLVVLSQESAGGRGAGGRDGRCGGDFWSQGSGNLPPSTEGFQYFNNPIHPSVYQLSLHLLKNKDKQAKNKA